MIFWKGKENKFGKRFIDIGLENVAVTAARVVELPPRYTKKVGKKRRCLQNARENHFLFVTAGPLRRAGP